VIVVSMVGDKGTAAAPGAAKYLDKPISRDRLTEALRRCQTVLPGA